MTGLNIFCYIVSIIMPIGFAVIFNLLVNKGALFSKLNKYVQQAIIGIVFFGCAIFSFTFGYRFQYLDNAILSSACLSVIIAVLYFSPIAGAIAAIPSFFFRAFAPCFLTSDIFRWTDASFVLFALIVTVPLTLYVFHRKKPNWLVSIFIGLFISVFNMLALYIFNLNRISEIYEGIYLYDISCITFITASLCLTSILVSLCDKKSLKIRIFTDKHLQAKIQRRLFIGMVAVFIVSFAAAYTINAQKTYSDSYKTINYSVSDMARQVNSSSKDQITSLANEQHILTNGFFVITDDENEIISIQKSYQQKYLNTYFAVIDGDVTREIRDYDTGVVNELKFDNTDFAISYQISSDSGYNIIGLVPMSEIASSIGIAVRVVVYLIILIICVLYVIVSNFINRMIVKNIHTINNSLNKLIDGDLDVEVKVNEKSQEFEELSNDINLTVGALKNYTTEINHRMEEEVELAKNIQLSSVPNVFPKERGFEVYASMSTGNEAGGDFYDYFRISENKVVILIADVVGAGIAATMYMIRAKTLLKSMLASSEKDDIDIEAVVNKCNQELTGDAMFSNGMTAFVSVLDLSTGHYEYVNADHCAPLIKQSGVYASLKCERNIYLGVDNNYHFKKESITLKAGDEILLFTDGITQAKDKNNHEYGVEGIAKVANATQYFNARQLITTINDDVLRHTGGIQPSDDLTDLCFRYTGYNEVKPAHEITLKAIPNNTPIATKFVESIMQQYNCSPKSQAIMLIAVDELFSNIAYYAYKGQPQPGNGTIRIEINGTEFKMHLIDSGVPFNPLEHLDPNYINSSAEERTNKGGLGIFMVRRSVDDMEYHYENGQNILTIIKNIPEMHEEEFKDSYSTTRD